MKYSSTSTKASIRDLYDDPCHCYPLIIWICNFGITLTTKVLKDLMQKTNDNFFGFEILVSSL